MEREISFDKEEKLYIKKIKQILRKIMKEKTNQN